MAFNQAKETIDSGMNPGEQAGELKTGDYKYRPPYRIHEPNDNFHAIWDASCHCGRVQYQLSREKPLNAKFCHCTTCQVLHGAPFQWAAIFHKDDINFTDGHNNLTWYDPPKKMLTHSLPCKVSCSYCRSPIMDEGRNMILLYPGLVKGIEKKENSKCFEVSCHMFYHSRVVDINDGKPKWAGLDNHSDLLDDQGNVIKKFEEQKPEPEKTAGDEPDNRRLEEHTHGTEGDSGKSTKI